MIKTQIQLPEELYKDLKALAEARGWSLAETLRRGAEYALLVYRREEKSTSNWTPPESLALGEFESDSKDWRELGNS